MPMQAAERAFAQPTKKGSVQLRCGADKPACSRMLGWTVLACFMWIGRFDDLCTLRWDPGFFEARTWGIRFPQERSERQDRPSTPRTLD